MRQNKRQLSKHVRRTRTHLRMDRGEVPERHLGGDSTLTISISKMAQLKPNNASLETEPWLFSSTPREAELMNDQIINAGVEAERVCVPQPDILEDYSVGAGKKRERKMSGEGGSGKCGDGGKAKE